MRKILIVDDELSKPGNAAAFAAEYPVEGVEFRFAGNGQEMFRLLEENADICVIFLDIRFEGEEHDHGLMLLKKLNDAGVSAPIVMISSLSDAPTIIRAWDLGAQGYVVKWSTNPSFYEEFRQKVAMYTRLGPPRSEEQVKRRRQRILIRAQEVLKEHADLTEEDIIKQALELKNDINGTWRYTPPFPQSFQNYVRGWNETDEVLSRAVQERRLLYLNMDFGDGCTLRCPHCFTQEGAIDARGRKPLPYARLREAILEAKELGLKCVRILGRGEPTQWIAGAKARSGNQPAAGEDLIDFIQFLYKNDIIPLIFTRGQILGDDERIAWAYGGAHGVNSAADLAKLLYENGVSLFVGVSSVFPEINNEMVGRPASDRYNYDRTCRLTLKHAIAAGFNTGNPTRLAVEMPITNLNIREMAARYVLFQCLGISPCTNVYMVAGRAMTYGLGDITGPSQEEFLEHYARVTYCARAMGIDTRIGSYAGTKECHDVSCGMYLTLNGDIYPCPGYEGMHNFVGSLRTHSIKEIWANNPYGGHPQSVCPPKIATHFPPDFEKIVEKRIVQNQTKYQDDCQRVVNALGVKNND
ncbi:MAG: response regulator [Deltaproteobacteria bacterium]|nr:response regulator [Deltaproteobacteria bacterium]